MFEALEEDFEVSISEPWTYSIQWIDTDAQKPFILQEAMLTISDVNNPCGAPVYCVSGKCGPIDVAGRCNFELSPEDLARIGVGGYRYNIVARRLADGIPATLRYGMFTIS